MAVFAPIEPEELVDQTELGFLRNGDNLGWLPLTAAFEDERGGRIMAVVPRRLDQEASDMTVAGLGDRTAVLPVAGGVLGGDQPEVGHERARGAEAAHIADLD